MRLLLSVRKLWVALFGSILVICSLMIALSSQKAQVLQSRLENANTESDNQRYKLMMREQRSLVQAAIMVRKEIDRNQYDGYAGIVLEEKVVILWWKGDLPKSMVAVVEEANTIAPVRTGQAKHSLAELKAAAAKIREQLGPGGFIHAIKNPGDGSRLIVAAPLEMGSPETKALVAGSLPKLDVEIEIVFENELVPISRNDDSPPWKGGAVIVNSSIGAACTSGFGVLAAGSPAILTAGHCATANGQRIQDGSGEFIGNAAQKTNHDQMIVPTTSTTNLIYVGPRSSNTTKTVTGWEPCFIGELICQSGVTTAQAIGSELCGLRVDQFNMDSESLVEAVQINGQQGARPGDSGGPLYSDQGASVIAKGTMTRVAGPRIGFQDIPTANQDFGGIVIPNTGGTAAVQLFQHCNFTGWRADFNNTGNFSTTQIQAAGGVNNDASSIRIAPGFRVTLFDGNNQTGSSVTLTANTSCFVSLNFNDVVSSMRIERIDGGGVVFFQNINFGGAQSQPLARGDYTLADLVARGVPNDWASSARVPSGFTVTIFQHDGFTGTTWTLTSDTPNFVTLTPNANDQMSSVRIQ